MRRRVVVDEGRVEIEDDVDEKYDVDDAVDDQKRNVGHRLGPECGIVRHHD